MTIMTEEITIDIMKEAASNLWTVGIVVGGLVGVVIKLWRGLICYRQALILMANTLKVEDKMVENTFKRGIFEKADSIGDIIRASRAAKDKVEDTLADINRAEVDRGGLVRLGSYKGNPVYASDALNLWRVFRNVFRKNK